MLERVPRLKAVLDDPKNSHHRRLIELSILHQTPVVTMIRDGFVGALRQEVIEHEVREQGEAFRAHVTSLVDANQRARYAYAKYKLKLPQRPAFDIIELAHELGVVVDSLSMDEFRSAFFPRDFSPEVDRSFITQYSLKRSSRMSMGVLIRPVHGLMDEFFLLDNVRTFRDDPSNETVRRWLERRGVVMSSLKYDSHGSASFDQGGCTRTLDPDSAPEAVLASLYAKFLNPITIRITFGFNPIL